MPTKKRRIGFIPSFDVLKVIDSISEEEKLSNSRVVNILIEEALYTRGLINTVEKNFSDKDLKKFINNINDFQIMLNKNDLKLDDNLEEFMQSEINTKMINRFIQFLHFTKISFNTILRGNAH